MTVFAHWVMDDVNTTAKTCAARSGAGGTLSLSNVNTLTLVDQANYALTAGSATKRKIAGINSLISGVPQSTIVSAPAAAMFSKHGIFSCDMVVKMVAGLSFRMNLVNVDDTLYRHRFYVSILTSNTLRLSPRQYHRSASSSVTSDTTSASRDFEFVTPGVCAIDELALLSMEIDASRVNEKGGRVRYRGYLNGEIALDSHSEDQSYDAWNVAPGTQTFDLVNESSASLNFLSEIMIHNQLHTLGGERARARYLRWRQTILTG